MGQGGVRKGYVRRHTNGWSAVRADLEATPWNRLVEVSGVPRAQVEAAARMLRRARRGIFCWAMGLTHHANGVGNVLALANLALARGYPGKPGAGLLPIRGHSNVQGVGSVGVTPVLKEAFARRLRELYDIAPASEGGMDTYRSMEAAAAGRIRAAFPARRQPVREQPGSGLGSARSLPDPDLGVRFHEAQRRSRTRTRQDDPHPAPARPGRGTRGQPPRSPCSTSSGSRRGVSRR